MPHALTPRLREYLDFIREYIRTNESSPRLEEIAEHFQVTSPTAHKALQSLQSKGYLYFMRDSVSGFFIRLIERAGSSETIIEVPITGIVNKYGELYDFPKLHGHFATVLMGADPGNIFALAVNEDIPEANMAINDLLICDTSKRPQPGDIAILAFGVNAERFFLCQIYSLTHDKDTMGIEVANQYPIPEDLLNKDHEQRLNWAPLAFNEETEDYFLNLAEVERMPMQAIPPELVLATVLRLSRNFAS